MLKLQEALVALGYDVGKLDGQYGPSTRKAIIAFQKKYKLGADGIVGKKTVKRLNAELKKLAQSQSCPPLYSPQGPLAQPVEQGTFNPKVAGSSPARPISQLESGPGCARAMMIRVGSL